MEVLIRKWGNSAAVRIPATVLAETGMALDQPVEVRQDRGRIVIEPLHRQVYSIADLVRGIRRDNLHEAVETGPAVGREVW